MPAAIQAEQGQFDKILRRNVTLPFATGVLSSILFVLVVFYLLSNLRGIERVQQVITQTAELGRLASDSEAGLRGYVITGDARFMEGYEIAKPRFQVERETLQELLAGDTLQQERVRRAGALYQEWDRFAQEVTALRRQNARAAVELVMTGHGKRLTDSLRGEFSRLVETERSKLAQRTAQANTNAIGLAIAYVLILLGFKGVLVYFGRRDLMALSNRFGSALQQQQEHTRYLEAQGWLREAQGELARVLAEHRDLHGGASSVLDFVGQRTGAVVAALYLVDEGGAARRVASFGLAPERSERHSMLAPHEGLVGQAARSGRLMRLSPLPAGYLQLSSGVAEGPAASALVVPLENEGRVVGVLEAGWLQELTAREAELLEQVAPIVGSALNAAVAREREQDLLQETQQLNEELQVQQEELRTANEELEEHARALKESQVNLEAQQAELEQTNLQISEFARRVEDQRDELQKAQTELEQRAQELERASQYKSEFLANMSHELRTPLNSSLILAKLLADNPRGNLDAEQVRFAESIYSAGNDLLTLINDILDIAKVEAGRLEIRPAPTEVAGVAQAMKSTFEPLAARKGLDLDVVVAPDLPERMVTDVLRLEQILRNLLGNAIKFTDQGSVALHVVRRGASVLFEVRDSGIGIEPSQQELIFEPFRQADSTTSRRHGGTGLGLSISRDLARLLGGDISLVSRPGQGSTFTLELPLEPAAQAAPPQAPTVPGAPPAGAPAAPAPAPAKPAAAPAPAVADDRAQDPAGRRTVLLVEDDKRFAQVLFDLAHELGYRCLVAHQADEGWELAARELPDAVLLDMQLPDDSGLSVLQRLKEDPRTRHIPVHVISVGDFSETALQMGAVGYALKPATRDELQEVFTRLEDKLSQKLKRVLIVEDDPRQQESIARLIADADVQITAVSHGSEALEALSQGVFDCMVTDLTLPDMSGQELLRRMSSGQSRSFPPVIVYTGRNLTRDEEAELLRYSRSIIIKGARSPERLLDEVTLFLHKVESHLSTERQQMLRTARNRDRIFESRRFLVVDDDVRNIFALTSALEQRGAEVVTARNGREALDKLKADDAVDLVLMDVMMPEMDGYTAMREIRRNPAWQRLPIIALTAKAMREDQQRCIAAGANDYLAKPVDLDRLFSLMRVWMPKLERI